jgi:TPP-dependent indolepyruvate ferredoxin oxidoreductase alpha subunit
MGCSMRPRTLSPTVIGTRANCDPELSDRAKRSSAQRRTMKRNRTGCVNASYVSGCHHCLRVLNCISKERYRLHRFVTPPPSAYYGIWTCIVTIQIWGVLALLYVTYSE